jgi:hypothetical protein
MPNAECGASIVNAYLFSYLVSEVNGFKRSPLSSVQQRRTANGNTAYKKEKETDTQCSVNYKSFYKPYFVEQKHLSAGQRSLG